jgi:hypothetical protein
MIRLLHYLYLRIEHRIFSSSSSSNDMHVSSSSNDMICLLHYLYLREAVSEEILAILQLSASSITASCLFNQQVRHALQLRGHLIFLLFIFRT